MGAKKTFLDLNGGKRGFPPPKLGWNGRAVMIDLFKRLGFGCVALMKKDVKLEAVESR
ncbi:MAG: hypothetical protein R6V12_14560 [Candidatus Hydrogenedentota bacterium]